MRCNRCGQEAVIGMRHHRLALCKSCYLSWFPRFVDRTIQQFHMFGRDDRVLVAVSGGKDSLSLWEVLFHLGYAADGAYIQLGIEQGRYSEQSLEMVRAFVEAHPGTSVHVVDLKSRYGISVPEWAEEKQGRKVCSLCGLVKRHEMNRVAYEGGYTVLATGHNVDDEVATLLQNTLHWQTAYLNRQGPVLPSTHPKLVRKVKPLCRLYEREVAAYALLRGIRYIYDECPFSKGAKSLFYKELLNQLEEASPASKDHFYLDFVRAKADGRMRFEDKEAARLQDCPKCGQPTTTEGLCAFCRLWVR